LSEAVAAKKKKVVKPQHLKDMIVFVKASISNPSFDSQTKETLTTQVSAFGSKCELSAKFLAKAYSSIGVVEKATQLTDFHDQKKLAKTDGKKRGRISVPKLDDATHAGTKDSDSCTLILTEGDSARTMAIAGLSVVGCDRYGVFPLRGKILNVKEAPVKKILENHEITSLKKIIGLKQGREYSDTQPLRYGRIMVMTDQDVGGSHIKGLLFNVFQSLWPSHYRMPGFVTSMLTPIVKATHKRTGTVTEFYNLTDYDARRDALDGNGAGFRVKYYKGLGTSTETEAKQYFRDLRVVTYEYRGKTSDEGMDLAFNKKRADDRKGWLMKYDKRAVLDYSNAVVLYKTFVHHDLIHFSNRDLERSINHVVDGLKESMRKILFGCFKRKLFTDEIRVAQLAAYISEHSAYHHGEASLQQAIINMAQDFVGSNNVNLLSPNGQFGCLAPDVEVLLWDGAKKAARDVCEGDMLIGDDGGPRRVLRTTSGRDRMYEIRMQTGESYTVNSQHILTVALSTHKRIFWCPRKRAWYAAYVKRDGIALRKETPSPAHDQREAAIERYRAYERMVDAMRTVDDSPIADISIRTILSFYPDELSLLRCVRCERRVLWARRNIPCDPYEFGCWLGGVRSDQSPFAEIASRSSDGIPEVFVVNEAHVRLETLAGVIDACCDVVFDTASIGKSSRMSEPGLRRLAYLASSLGLPARTTRALTTSLIVTFRVSTPVPMRDPRKRVCCYGHAETPAGIAFTIAPHGYGDFCGWAVDGIERFLLADFTVTHNSRIAGGQDAASPRYIHTTLTPLARKLFRTEDHPVLACRSDNGVSTEPEFYVPVLPTVLMNGALGIGTGFSTNLPCFDPSEIAGACVRMIDAIDASFAEMDDTSAIKAVIDAIEIPLFHPWYAGFEGTISPLKPGAYKSTGVWKWVNDTTVEVSELPVGTWTDDYKTFLTGLVDDGSKTLRDFEGRYTERSPNFVLRMHASSRSEVQSSFAADFKLESTKNLGMNNVHLYTVAGAIRKFADVAEILREWSKTRVDTYLARKRYQIATTERNLSVVTAKVRFIQDIIKGRIVVNNAKHADLVDRLAEARYPPFNEDSGGDGYAYLTRMPIYHLTYEKKRALEEKAQGLEAGLAEMRSTSIQETWSREICEFDEAWEEHIAARRHPM
jgi:hypothetical protein